MTSNPAHDPLDGKPVIDEDRLNQVTEGDAEFKRELMLQFQLDMERNLGDLAGDLAKRDMNLIIRLAHNIKGTSSNVGVLRLSAAAAALEAAARAGDANSCGSLHQDVVREYQQFLSRWKSLAQESP